MRRYSIFQLNIFADDYLRSIPANPIIPAYTNAPFLLILPEKGLGRNLFTHAFVMGLCYYLITRCSICTYMKKIGASELMPLFCELDEVTITLQHGLLHQKQTLANGGEYCDYFITENKE